MRELTCIVCPIGCSLLVEEGAEGSAKDKVSLTITGNRCKRGAVYAQEEIRSPKRVVTATCGIAFSEVCPQEIETPGEVCPRRSLTAPRRIPVKSSAPCPKEMINALLEDINRLKLKLPVKTGDRPIVNWNNTGIDVVVVRDLQADWSVPTNRHSY